MRLGPTRLLGFEGLARIAMHDANSVEIGLRAHSELVPYVAAKCEAVNLAVANAEPPAVELIAYSGGPGI